MKKLFYKQINSGLSSYLKKSIVILLFVGFSNLLLAAPLFSVQVRNFEIKNATLKQAIEYILKDSKYNLTYSLSDIDSYKNISFKVESKTPEETLKNVLGEHGLTYNTRGNNIVISKAPVAQVSNVKITLTGKVLDDNKRPIAGATVSVVGTSTGAITDDKGSFTIVMNKGQEIEISCVGMLTVKKKIDAASTNFVIELKSDTVVVDDVVVTGYFNRKKESYTGATTTFTGKDLRSISTGSLLNSLSMLDPSFAKVVNNDMGSNPNSIPEFEIRGSSNIKSEYQGSTNMPTFIMDGFEVSPSIVFDLDPTRVKSMTILKDAAAAAIYGSRAANGVVVIETIAPAAGKLRISYNMSVNFEAADLSDYNLMNAKEKLLYEAKAGLFNPNNVSPDSNDQLYDTYNQRLKLIAKGYNTDWIKLPVKRLGAGHRHTVGLEGGNESFRYGFDIYYSNKEGVMKSSNRDTYGGVVKLQYNYKNLKFTNYSSFDHLKSRNSPFGNFSEYTVLNPYYYPYNEDGSINKILYSYRYYDRGFTSKDMPNMFYNSTLPFKDESITNTLINNLAMEYDILPGLKFKAGISLGLTDTRTDVYRSREHTAFMQSKAKGSYSQSFNKGFNYDANVTVSYFKEMNKHAINLGAVYNVRENSSDGTSIYVEGFPNPQMDHIGMGLGYVEGARPNGTYDVSRLIGFVGNAGYSYDNKYLMDASIRSDASSLFGADKRWGTFWSFGLGWNIHKEKFMEGAKAINLLKLRGSIGTTGGQNFYSFQALSMYSYNDSYIKDIVYAGYGGAILKAYGNRNLKWQKIEKKNIGLDFELLNSRITGTFNYYSDLSKDLLVDVILPPSSGFSSYKENLGSVKNEGFEISLRGAIIRNVKQDLRWDVSFNLVQNKNKLMKINEMLLSYNSKQDSQVGSRPMVRYQEGMSVNTIWANESLGIDPATGDELFVDRDGNMVNTWSVNNYKPLGNTDAKVYGTFGTSFYYKGWEFNASFYYKAGGQNYNQTLVSKIENVNPNENGDRRILSDRWFAVGDVAKYKRISDVSLTQPTSRFIEKENLVQLQSLSFAYQFDSQQLRKIGIERCRIAAIGNDIFTTSTIRMERGISYPFARTFSVSLQLTF